GPLQVVRPLDLQDELDLRGLRLFELQGALIEGSLHRLRRAPARGRLEGAADFVRRRVELELEDEVHLRGLLGALERALPGSADGVPRGDGLALVPLVGLPVVMILPPGGQLVLEGLVARGPALRAELERGQVADHDRLPAQLDHAAYARR